MTGSGIAAATEISRLSPAVALGYVLKGADPEEIVRAITAFAAGGAVLGSTIDRRVLGGLRPAGPASGISGLSERESRALDPIAAGLGNPAIAERLAIGEAERRPPPRQPNRLIGLTMSA